MNKEQLPARNGNITDQPKVYSSIQKKNVESLNSSAGSCDYYL